MVVVFCVEVSWFKVVSVVGRNGVWNFMVEMQDNVVLYICMCLLRDVICKVQFGEVEWFDVVVEFQDMECVCLDMFVDELKDVFKEILLDDDQFFLQIIVGLMLRFWIDVIGYVVVGGDKCIYWFLKDM